MKTNEMKREFENVFNQFKTSQAEWRLKQKELDEAKDSFVKMFVIQCESLARQVILEEHDALSFDAIEKQFDEIKNDTTIDGKLKVIAYHACMKVLKEVKSTYASTDAIYTSLF